MIIIAIGVIFGFYVVFSSFFSNFDDRELFDYVGACSLGILFASLFGGLLFLLCWGIGYLMPKHLEVEKTIALVSINNSIGIQGSFFLGSGFIESKQYYFYMEKLGSSFIPHKVVVEDNVFITENSQEKPKIIFYTFKFKSKYTNLIAVYPSKEVIEIVIPKNSVKYGFNL